MNVLLISQYFWPENFRVNDLIESLDKNKFNIEVLTGLPNYPNGEVFDEYLKDKDAFKSFHGVPINRVKVLPRGNSKFSLLLNYFSFVISSSLWILKNYKKKNFMYA